MYSFVDFLKISLVLHVVIQSSNNTVWWNISMLPNFHVFDSKLILDVFFKGSLKTILNANNLFNEIICQNTIKYNKENL